MPVKIISGVKQSITSVSFQPLMKLMTRAATRAPTALNIADKVGPVKPFNEAASVESRVTKAPKLFSSESNQPISCLSMLRNDIVLMRIVNSSPALAKVSEDSIWNKAPPTPMRKIVYVYVRMEFSCFCSSRSASAPNNSE